MFYANCTGIAVGRVSAPGSEGNRFNPGQRHVKVISKDTNYATHGTRNFELLLVAPVSVYCDWGGI